MRPYLVKSLAFTTCLAGFSLGLAAQDTTQVKEKAALFSGVSGFRTWSIGVHGGMLMPALAIGGRNDFSKWKPTFGYGVYVQKQLSHRFGLQAEFLRGTLKATNERPIANGTPPQSPYTSFETDLNWSAAFKGVLTVSNINWTQMHTVVQPYFSLGAGLASYNPTLVTNSGTTVDYKPNGSIKEMFIPVGLGLKFNLSNTVNLDLGYTMNFVDGDNLDGYFKEPYTGDKFSYTHLGLEFSLGKKSQPQLAAHNPAAQLARDLQDENNALRASVAANDQKLKQQLAQTEGLKDELDRMKADADKDGVSDYFDKCPGTPAGVKVDGSGCPLPAKDTTIVKEQKYYVTEEDKKVVNEAIKNLEFDFGKATIRSTSFASLNRVAGILVQKGFSLKLAGHTDNVGSDDANMKLSKARAESVKQYLVSQGANPSRIEAVGYGETQPITSNKTAAGRQKNRRVEFTLY